jgi:hypothetical protein
MDRAHVDCFSRILHVAGICLIYENFHSSCLLRLLCSLELYDFFLNSLVENDGKQIAAA